MLDKHLLCSVSTEPEGKKEKAYSSEGYHKGCIVRAETNLGVLCDDLLDS